MIEYLNRMVELASSFGVTLCHENEKGIYGDNAERVEDLMRSVPNLQFVYDPANFLQVGERAEQTLERFSSRCTYFHIKDVLMETGELVPAGCGDGDIPRLLELNAYRDTVLTLEPHLKIFGAYTEIDGEEMKHRFHFSDNAEAFDAAANALKGLLLESGYRGRSGCYTKEIF